MDHSLNPTRRISCLVCPFAWVILGVFPQIAVAGGKGHAAHEHGVATVNVVAEGNGVTIQLEAPSDSIYGFEHEATKPADVKKRDEAIEKLKANADKMFLLDASLGCRVASSEIKPFVTEEKESANGSKKGHKNHKQGTHSEVHATFKFECGKPVAGSSLKFAARSHFKALRTLKVQVLSGERQSGNTFKNDKGSVQL
ncbi:MAG: hypothetical protein RI953_1694 [Pseudomonadota bacterium]|jgi:uncharacterized protein YbjQ (UPF0145 family)